MKLHLSKDVYFNKLFLIFLLMSFLKPSGFDAMGYDNINLFFNISRIIFSVYIVFRYCVRKKTVSRFIIAESLYFCAWILSYALRSQSVINIVILAISIVVLTLLTDYFASVNKINKLIDAYIDCYIILLFTNLFLIISTYGWKVGINNGIYEHFSFLSSDNATAGYILPAIFLCMLDMDNQPQKKNKSSIIKLVLVLALATLNEIRMWSATALVGIILILIYIFFLRNIRSIKMKWLFFGSVLLNIGITLFRIQNLFSFVIEKMLNKTLTFTGRTVIWDWALNQFIKNPIFGNGADGNGLYYIDNLIVQLLYRGGIVLLLTFLLFMFLSIKDSGALKNENMLTRDILFMLSTVCIMSIAESWNSFMGFYIIIIFSVYMNKINRKI